jgi:uncharacterized protein (DUF697 family)
MNKKKLPKVIRRSADEPRETMVGLAESEARASPMHGAELRERADSTRAAHNGHGGDAAAAKSPVLSAPSSRGALTRMPPRMDSVRRRSRALAIVERHATYSAVGGLIPLPMVNVVSVTGIIVRMVKVLSDLYGVPFARDRARAIIVGLVGGAMPTGLAAATTSTLYYVIPASALVGLAVSSVAAVACTRNIGRVFVEHFESGATLDDISIVDQK